MLCNRAKAHLLLISHYGDQYKLISNERYGKFANDFNQDSIKTFIIKTFFLHQETIDLIFFIFTAKPQFSYLNSEDSSGTKIK